MCDSKPEVVSAVFYEVPLPSSSIGRAFGYAPEDLPVMETLEHDGCVFRVIPI